MIDLVPKQSTCAYYFTCYFLSTHHEHAAVLQLPTLEEVKTPEMLEKLTTDAAAGGQEGWEAGAQSNFMIAAARLGLRVASVANLGQDVYGDFLKAVLKVIQAI